MSDFNMLDKKIQEGVSWTGHVNVSVDGEQVSVAVRQLNDPELREVLSLIDREELTELQGELPTDKMEEYQELVNKDELEEQDRMRLEVLEKELNNVNILDYISEETFSGITKCAMYAIVPDNDDIMEMFNDHKWVNSVEERYGITIRVPADLYNRDNDMEADKWAGPAKDYMQKRLRQSTNFTTFVLGMQALMETTGDEKNSETTLHQTTGQNLSS